MPGVYDESKIQSLSAIEHIRKRPGMYIGRLGDGSNSEDGIYILLKEIIDNSVDEFIMKCGNRIEISIENNLVSIRDYGRGIPHGKLIDCVSKINTGGKFTNEVFQKTVGLNGVGTKAVNALSSYFKVSTYRDQKASWASFERGQLKDKGEEKEEVFQTGTKTEFIPDNDPEIFGNFSFNLDIVSEMLWNYAYLNPGLTIYFNDKIFKSRGGLKDFISKKIGNQKVIYEPLRVISKDGNIEFALTHLENDYNETYFSYANGQYTYDGGTHQSYFKEAVYKTINDFFKKTWSPSDVREGIVAAISVKLDEPHFDSQTKSKLTNTEIKGKIFDEVQAGLSDYFLKSPSIAAALAEKITRVEKMHKEIAEVKKSSKEVSEKSRLNIPKLKDCKYHLNGKNKKDVDEGKYSMIFICEGDSAAGTITQVRDVYHQAIFALRGKVLNCYGEKRSIIYKNEELYNLMIALGIEESVDNLRYDKIVIATDADNDGFHIRNLLMTYFLSYFPELILTGKVYILETPLFRVRNKVQTEYCYTEEERDNLVKKIQGAEITRFKGLGEIAPKEFGQFIGSDIRLVPVNVSSIEEIKYDLQFYMGDNTPERKQFIMENLI